MEVGKACGKAPRWTLDKIDTGLDTDGGLPHAGKASHTLGGLVEQFSARPRANLVEAGTGPDGLGVAGR